MDTKANSRMTRRRAKAFIIIPPVPNTLDSGLWPEYEAEFCHIASPNLLGAAPRSMISKKERAKKSGPMGPCLKASSRPERSSQCSCDLQSVRVHFAARQVQSMDEGSLFGLPFVATRVSLSQAQLSTRAAHRAK